MRSTYTPHRRIQKGHILHTGELRRTYPAQYKSLDEDNGGKSAMHILNLRGICNFPCNFPYDVIYLSKSKCLEFRTLENLGKYVIVGVEFSENFLEN